LLPIKTLFFSTILQLPYFYIVTGYRRYSRLSDGSELAESELKTTGVADDRIFYYYTITFGLNTLVSLCHYRQ